MLDFLHDDQKTLRACTRTCRAWLPTSYRHIFSCISLETFDSCVAFNQLIQDAPHLNSMVREMVVEIPRKYQRTASVTPLPFSPSILTSLTFVNHLHIHAWSDHTMSSMDVTVLRHLRSVTHLTLRSCCFITFDAFTSFIQSFCELLLLDIGNISWGEEAIEAFSSADVCVRMPTPKEVVLGSVTNLTLLVGWIIAGGVHSKMVTASVRCSSEYDAAALGDLLLNVTGSFTSLHINWLWRRILPGG